MLVQSKAKIFHGSLKPFCKNESGQSSAIYFSDNTTQSDNNVFGSIYLVEEYCFEAGNHARIQVKENSVVILLPVAGAICYRQNAIIEYLVKPGEAFIGSILQEKSLHILNPYENEKVRFLIFCFNCNNDQSLPPMVQPFEFEMNRNHLFEIFLSINKSGIKNLPAFSIGSYNAGIQSIYLRKDRSKNIFCFVLNGIFEIQHILLETSDGLFLWDKEIIEIETFSPDSFLILIES